MQTTVAVETLESVNAKLTDLRGQQKTLQSSLDRLAERAGNISAQRRALLLKGDATTGNQVETLEHALADLSREGESLQLRIDALTAPIQAAEAERVEMAQQAWAAECIRKTEELTRESERLAHNRCGLWRAACRAAYDEAEFHSKVMEASGLSQQQKALVHEVAKDIFDRTGGAVWNERWEKVAVHFTGLLTIQPMKAPDELRHLENLK